MIRDLSELKVGDPVVHLDHGVGGYRGLTSMSTPDGEAEFLQIDYAKEAKTLRPGRSAAFDFPIFRRGSGNRPSALLGQRRLGEGSQESGSPSEGYGCRTLEHLCPASIPQRLRFQI